MVEKVIEFFNLRKIMNSGQIFRMYEDGEGIFTVYSSDRRLKVKEKDGKIFFYCCEEEFESCWEDFFDLKRDYGSIVQRAYTEPLGNALPKGRDFLKAACTYASDIRILNQNVWEMMISFIISQQKQIPSIRKCIEALCERFGTKHTEINGEAAETWYGFPDAGAIASAGPEGLKGLSLGYRERYIYETAVRYLSEGKTESFYKNMTYEQARKYLCTFSGIGEKVADCVCLFGCGFSDAFPIDVHIKEVLYREFFDESGKRAPFDRIPYSEYMTVIDKSFAPFSGVKGIVQQWIFAYELTFKGKKRK